MSRTYGRVPDEVKALLRHGSNYPCGILLDDGALICCACARSEYHQLVYAARHRLDDGWRPVAAVYEVHAEEAAEYCAHCASLIAETNEQEDLGESPDY